MTNIVLNFSLSYPLVIFPFIAKDITPVSSDTIITKASDISDNPIAALCLVPNFLLILMLFVKGKTHPDVNIILFLIIVYRSCSVVLIIKIFSTGLG